MSAARLRHQQLYGQLALTNSQVKCLHVTYMHCKSCSSPCRCRWRWSGRHRWSPPLWPTRGSSSWHSSPRFRHNMPGITLHSVAFLQGHQIHCSGFRLFKTVPCRIAEEHALLAEQEEKERAAAEAAGHPRFVRSFVRL